VAAVVTESDRVLLVRHEKEGTSYWLLPGGGVEFGETLEQALEREVREETGLSVRVGNLLLVNDTIPSDRHRHILHLTFCAEVLGGTLVTHTDERLRGAQYRPLSELTTGDLRPDIGTELAAVLKEDQTPTGAYLGNTWRD
jgi:ADP-ribose pyrophosphatase YjhB (NUDIX family)